MKKTMLFAAIAAIALASCAKNEVIQNQGPEDAVGFGVYVPKTVTKAGLAGQTTTTSIKESEANKGGFGVFAYYTDDKNYAAAVAASENKPNFMYNQGVFWTPDAPPAVTGKWEYTPIKYWPNEYGSEAHSAATDYVSFFAYAPYVSNADFASPGSYNITAKSANAATGDPTITYVIDPTPSTAVDLCWAVNAATGLPWLDQTKHTVDKTTPGTIDFKFKHALARFNVNVRGYFDEVRTVDGAGSTDNIDVNTKITIEEVEISGTFYPSGVLNLNNTTANTALWVPAAATPTTLTIPRADIATVLKATAGGETSFPAITGVTKTNVNIFTGAAPAKTDATYYTFIPKADATTLNVKITYYVTTQDAKLDGGISCVKNVIDKDIIFGSGFACGYNYNLNIVLGMTTVKLEATVSDWEDASDIDIDLPVNLPANSFNLASTAAVTLTAGSGETAAVWTTAEGTVSIYSIQKDASVFDNSTNIVAVDNANKKITFTGAAAGVYEIQLTAAGDGSHNSATMTITVTVTGS